MAHDTVKAGSLTPDDLRLMGIFQPYLMKKYSSALSSRMRFVHYCSASVALSIIRNKEIWMRNVSCMNDFMEVEHGIKLIRDVYDGDLGGHFRSLINEVAPGSIDEFQGLFNGWLRQIRFGTYITCLSEHSDHEDELGRLSMWRAYGRGAGIALVINSDAMLSESNALNAFSTPVAYLDDRTFRSEFRQIIHNIEDNREFLREKSGNLSNQLFWTFLFASLSIKHPGFVEEREWRVVHLPEIYPSERLSKTVHDVGGAPQTIYKIPFKNVPQEGLTGLNPNELLNRVIVGPSDNALVIAEALRSELRDAGVEEADEMVAISNIPLR